MTSVAGTAVTAGIHSHQTLTFVSADPPLRVTMLRGLAPPLVTGGLGGWVSVQRPRRKSLTEWPGMEPVTLTLPILFDAHITGRSVENEIAKLERLAKPPGSGEPPIVRIVGAVPHANLIWVIQSLGWQEPVIYHRVGYRTRQAATVTLLEYVADDRLSGASAAERARRQAADDAAEAARRAGVGGSRPLPGQKLYTVRAGDTLARVAADQLGDYRRWVELADLNGLRDPRALVAGQVVRLP